MQILFDSQQYMFSFYHASHRNASTTPFHKPISAP